ncbi:MAG: hypothetical protein R6U61_07195 [Thermoplasmata archaeon]
MKLKESMKREKFTWMLFSLSLLFFLLTILFTDPGHPEASPYWYISELYWTFWLGLLLSVFCVYTSMDGSRWMKVMSILLPVLYIYTLPSMVHDMMPVFDVYHVIPPALSILKTGEINLVQTNFPMSHVYYASGISILNINGLVYARLVPTIIAFVVVLGVYVVAKRFDDRYAVFAPLIFVSLNWYMEYHMARQGYGVMLWTVFFVFLFLAVYESDIKLGLLAGVLLILIIPSHPGIIIIVSFNLIFLAGFKIVDNIKRRDLSQWSVFLYPAVFFLTLFIAYKFVPEINEFLGTLIEQVQQGGFQGFALGGPPSSSQSYLLTNRIRMAMGLFHSLFGFLALIFIFKKGEQKTIVMGSWFLGCYLWLAYSFTHNGYLVERSFLTSVIPASIMIPYLIDKDNLPFKRFDLDRALSITTVLMVVLFLLFIPIAKNSVDAIETPSRSAFDAGRFAQNNMEGRVYMTDTHEGMFRYLEATANSSVSFRSRRAGAAERYELGMNFGYSVPATSNPNVSPLLFTDYFLNYFTVRYGNETVAKNMRVYEKQVSRLSGNIYDSGGARVYSRV